MFAQESVMDIQKEKEAFEVWFESRYDAHFMQFALDLDLYVDKHTQTCWEAWQAAKSQAVPEGFVLVNAESLSLHTQSIRMFSNGNEENYYYEIENHVCAIEAMIEAQEPAND